MNSIRCAFPSNLIFLLIINVAVPTQEEDITTGIGIGIDPIIDNRYRYQYR